MKTLLNKLTQKDKLLHFAAGVMIYLLLCLFIPNHWALLSVYVIALGKELFYDLYLKKGTPELLDYMVTVLPPTLMLIIL